MPKPPASWPAGALPRRMTRELAAYYCGLSVNTFDSHVQAGRYPSGIRIGGRVVWDLVALDRALDIEAGTAVESQLDRDRAELDRMYGHGVP